MTAGRPPKYETPEEMQGIIDLYFLACRVHQEMILDNDKAEERLIGLTEIKSC